MDRETAVIRAEMTQTRAELDHKLTLLEHRARQLSPRRYAKEYLPDYAIERALGSVLTLIGVGMAVKQLREHRRRNRMRRSMGAYAACWSHPTLTVQTTEP